jgi:hypothetical protein
MSILHDLRTSRRPFLAALSSLAALPLLPGMTRARTSEPALVIDTAETPAPVSSGVPRLRLAGERLDRLESMTRRIRVLRAGDAVEAHLDGADLLFLQVAVERAGRTARIAAGPHSARLVII